MCICQQVHVHFAKMREINGTQWENKKPCSALTTFEPYRVGSRFLLGVSEHFYGHEQGGIFGKNFIAYVLSIWDVHTGCTMLRINFVTLCLPHMFISWLPCSCPLEVMDVPIMIICCYFLDPENKAFQNTFFQEFQGYCIRLFSENEKNLAKATVLRCNSSFLVLIPYAPRSGGAWRG